MAHQTLPCCDCASATKSSPGRGGVPVEFTGEEHSRPHYDRANRRTTLYSDRIPERRSRSGRRPLDHSRAFAARVRDPRQLQAIESGALFRGIAEKIGYSSLSEIKRQANVDDRQMIKHLIDGRSEEVIEQLSQAGQLVVKGDDQVIETMVRDWQANSDPARPGESLMLAGSKSDVAALNRCARDLLKSEHRLHSEITISTESGDQEFCIGERVLFTRNQKAIGVRNGEKGTLTDWRLNAATGNVELTVMKDDGERVIFEPSQYGYISHAYAVSVHKAQGSTCDQVSVLMSESMGDREWSYVALSRHRQRLRVFVPESVGGDLENKLSRSRQKSLASDYQVPVKQVASLECE